MLQETLNSAKYCCGVCNKEYTRKSSLDKHKILCDFKISIDKRSNKFTLSKF